MVLIAADTCLEKVVARRVLVEEHQAAHLGRRATTHHTHRQSGAPPHAHDVCSTRARAITSMYHVVEPR